MPHLAHGLLVHGQRELYNLADDLSETTGLAERMPDCVRLLDEKLQAWLAAAEAKMPIANPEYQGR